MSFVLQRNLSKVDQNLGVSRGKLSLPEAGLPDFKSYFILDDFQIWQRPVVSGQISRLASFIGVEHHFQQGRK